MACESAMYRRVDMRSGLQFWPWRILSLGPMSGPAVTESLCHSWDAWQSLWGDRVVSLELSQGSHYSSYKSSCRTLQNYQKKVGGQMDTSIDAPSSGMVLPSWLSVPGPGEAGLYPCSGRKQSLLAHAVSTAAPVAFKLTLFLPASSLWLLPHWSACCPFH